MKILWNFIVVLYKRNKKMKLFEYIDKSQFDEMVALDYIKVVDHPSGCGHKLINYTKLCNSVC